MHRPSQVTPPQPPGLPEHLVDMLVPLWRTLPTDLSRPHVRPGTPEYAAAVRAEIRAYVQQIWAEALHAGAAFGLAWSAQPIRLIVEDGQAADTLVEALLSARTREAVPGGC